MIEIEITLAEVKEALRIDYDDEDTYLQLCLDAAKAHVEDAIDDYATKITEPKMQSKAKIAIIAITQDLFDNRVYTFASTDKSEAVENMAAEIKEIATSMKGHQDKINERVTVLENKPGGDAYKLQKQIFGYVVAIAVAFVLGKFGIK